MPMMRFSPCGGTQGVALLTVVGEDAFAGKTRRLFGERAVFIDGVGNDRVDTIGSKPFCVGHPNIEIFSTMARRRVDEPGTGIIRHMIATQQRYAEFIANVEILEGMRAR